MKLTLSIINYQGKRKANLEQLEEQPSLKKMEIDGEVGVVMTNSLPSHRQGEMGVRAPSVDSNMGPSSSGQRDNETTVDSRARSDKHDNQTPRHLLSLRRFGRMN